MKKTYKDYVLNYIHDGLINFKYDYQKAVSLVTESNWSSTTKVTAEQSLICFGQKKFVDLHKNDEDGRVFNEFVAMKSDLRKIFTYKNLINQATIDIRACHATFFSSYILSLNLTNPKLLQEHNKWINLFTNPNIDPRDVIAQECGYQKTECKKALNETMNGHKSWKIMQRWIEFNFPEIYALWSLTDKKQTGPNISKNFESILMLDQQLYKIAETMDMKFAYEYDGLSVFSFLNDGNLVSKLNYISNYLTSLAIKNFGVPIVIKVKMITK